MGKNRNLDECKSWNDIEGFLKHNDFEYSRTNGGHKIYKKNGHPIPVSTHEKEPSKHLRSQIFREIMTILGAGVFFFFVLRGLGMI